MEYLSIAIITMLSFWTIGALINQKFFIGGNRYVDAFDKRFSYGIVFFIGVFSGALWGFVLPLMLFLLIMAYIFGMCFLIFYLIMKYILRIDVFGDKK